MYSKFDFAGHLLHLVQVALPVVLYSAMMLSSVTEEERALPEETRTLPAAANLAPAVLPQIPSTTAEDERPTLDEILKALRVVETGGLADGGRRAVGDRGKAIGPLQIHRAYWRDSRVPGAYGDCRDPAYACAVVVSYWRRYCPEALESLDAEVLARVHNGGPDGHRERSTKAYWRKVERELAKQRDRVVHRA